MAHTTTLAKLEGDIIVLHFGGVFASINADVFARSLIGFVQTARAVSHSIEPDDDIEFRLETMADGSFRAVVKKIQKHAGGFLGRGAENVCWGIVGAVIFNQFAGSDPKIMVTTTTNEVVIETGSQRVVVPRNVYDAARNAEKVPAVQQGLRETFSPLEEDTSITEFGLTQSISAEPLFKIPRSHFPIFSDDTRVVEIPSYERVKSGRANLVILKAWLNHSNRKWTFDWNGMLVSAFIEDVNFLDKLQRRDFKLGAGDALDAVLVYKETFLNSVGTFVIDHNSFVVTEVKDIVSTR